jgi:hypothetical protein
MALLVTACHRAPVEDPAEQVYRGAVQLFAQASAASHDLTYRDPRFDPVLTALAQIPEGSEFRSEADALATRIRTARERANAADAESQKAIDRALAQPTFESQGKVETTQGSVVTPKMARPSAAVPPPEPMGPNLALPSAAAARAQRRSLAAGAQEGDDETAQEPPEPSTQDEPAPAPRTATRTPPPPPSPPPTPPGQVFGLPGPAGRAMGTRPTP